MTLGKLQFSSDREEFEGQKRKLETLFKKAGEPRDSCRYTNKVMLAINSDYRGLVYTRLGHTRRTIHTVSYSEVLENLSHLMEDLDRGNRQEPGEVEPKKVIMKKNVESDGEKRSQQPTKIEIVKSPETMESLSRQLEKLTLQYNSLVNQQPSVQTRGGEGKAGRRGVVYPTFLNQVERDEGAASGGREGYRGGGYGRDRGGGNRDVRRIYRCFYCGEKRHTMYDCDVLDEDSRNEIVNIGGRYGSLHYGGAHEMGGPLAPALFRHFKDDGKIRNVIWSQLEKNPGWPGAQAMRTYIENTGDKVETGIQYTTVKEVPNGPIVLPPKKEESIVVPTQYLEIVRGPSDAEKKIESEDPIDSSLMDVGMLGCVDAKEEVVEVPSIQVFYNSMSDEIGKEKERIEQEKRELLLKKNAEAKNKLVAKGNQSVVPRTVRQIESMAVKMTLGDVARLSRPVAKQLAGRFNDIADSVVRTIRIGPKGDVVGEEEGPDERRRKRARNGDGEEVPNDDPPTVIPVLSQKATTAGLIGALGHLKVIVGDSMAGGLPIEVVVDSGSSANTINENLAHKAQLAITPTTALSRSVHGTEERFLGVVTTTVWIGGHPLVMRFFVTPSLKKGKDKPLFGMPFMYSTKFAFEYKENFDLFGRMIIGDIRLIMPMVFNDNVSNGEDEGWSGKA